MPTYHYTARDRAGAASTGIMTGRSVAELREQLRSRDLFLTEVREHAEPGARAAKARGLLRRRSVKLDEMVVMSRQLAVLVKAGLPINEALFATASQTENPVLVDALRQVRLDILTGSTLTDALRRHPPIFPEQYVSLVQAGETGGVLDETLETAADQFDKESELRTKVKAAFVYPTIVVVAAALVVAFMLVFIVPAFARVYDQFHAELPAVTKALVLLSHAVVHYWWMFLLGGAALFLVIRRWVQTPRGRRQYDRLKLRLPLLGKLIRKIAIARFSQTFAALTRAGVPVLRALTVSGHTSNNVIIMEAVGKVVGFVKEGASISVPLEQTGEFPQMVTRMIAAGEQSGNLDEMLEAVVQFYERDIEYTVGKLTRLLEPIMTGVVGGIVLFVLLALYMPVFNLTQVVRR